MNNRILKAGLLLLVTSTLAACGGDKSATGPVAPPTVVAPAPQENAFGANFGTTFRAPTTAAPVTPADGDIIPLSLITNPTPVG